MVLKSIMTPFFIFGGIKYTNSEIVIKLYKLNIYGIMVVNESL